MNIMTDTHSGKAAIGNVASQYQGCKEPSFNVCESFHDLATINFRVLVSGLVCSHALYRNQPLFFSEEFSVSRRIWKSEKHECAPGKGGDPENDEKPLRMKLETLLR
jgi:hypothetical protein